MNFDKRTHSLEQSLTLAMASYAMVIFHSATVEYAHRKWITLLWVLVPLGLMFAMFTLLRSYDFSRAKQPKTSHELPTTWGTLLLGVLAAFPFAREALLESYRSGLFPLEVLMIESLSTVGLGLAAACRWSHPMKLSVVVSLFVTLFGMVLGSSTVLLALVGTQFVLTSCWLMLLYWNNLRATSPEPLRLPWALGTVLLFLVSGTFAVAAIGPKRTVQLLGELMPTSGGTGEYDRRAQGGVNDGDDEVAGNNPQSVGYVENDRFLESPDPSLYDVVSETYGEPYKPKGRDRTIALSQDRILEAKRELEKQERAGREFSLSREQPRNPRHRRASSTDALLYVEGTTPLHLPMMVYDRFDGQTWHLAQPSRHTLQLTQTEPSDSWMHILGLSDSPIFAETEEHEIKIARLKTQSVLTPNHVIAFRVGRVNQSSFFASGQVGLIRMIRPVPQNTTIATRSRTVDPQRLCDHWTPDKKPSLDEDPYLQVPKDLAWGRTHLLAQKWSAGHPRGWHQIEAVVHGLRQRCIHDPNARAPANCTTPIDHFLFESRRGEDYMFATSAVVLLRSLGYPSRLVNGFYASPKHFDSTLDMTPILKNDVHFWVQVRMPSGRWVTVEPTPGYEILPPKYSLWQRLWAGVQSTGYWLFRHRWQVASLSLMALLTVGFRKRLFERVHTLAWQWLPAKSWRKRVCQTLSLLERRATWAGQPRPDSATLVQWYSQCTPFSPDKNRARCLSWMRMVEWALYAPPTLDAHLPFSEADIREACQSVVLMWSVSCLRDGIATSVRTERTDHHA